MKATISAPNTPAGNAAPRLKHHKISDAAGYAYTFVSTALVIFVCLFIIGIVLYFGHSVLSISFLTTEPNASARDALSGGILTPMLGTIILTLLGIVVAFPFALATALYLCFYAKPGFFRSLISGAIDVLAGLPTVVIALFALAIFTQPWTTFLSTGIEGTGSVNAYGKSFLVASITMAIMVLPFVSKAMEESLRNVPASYIEGSYALGAGKWRILHRIVIKSASRGLITGVILGMGRIIGDTAIVWLTLGGTLRMTGLQPWYAPENWLSTLQNTGSTLTTYIYYTSPAGEGNNFEVAFGAALVLIVIIIILNAAATVVGNIGNGKGE